MRIHTHTQIYIIKDKQTKHKIIYAHIYIYTHTLKKEHKLLDIFRMNCKICLKNYNTFDIKPELIIPCCDILCMICLTDVKKCPLCNEIIIEKQPSQDVINKLEQNKLLKQNYKLKLEKIEEKAKILEENYSIKKQSNKNNLIKIEQEIDVKFNELYNEILNQKERLLQIVRNKSNEINSKLDEIIIVHNNEIKAELNSMKINLTDSNLINVNELNIKLSLFEANIDQNMISLDGLNNTQIFVNKNDTAVNVINLGQINDESSLLKLPVRLNEDNNNQINETQQQQQVN